MEIERKFLWRHMTRAQEQLAWLQGLPASPERDALISRLPVLEATREMVEAHRATQAHFNRRHELSDEDGYLTREQFDMVSDELSALVRAKMEAEARLQTLEADGNPSLGG